MAKILFDVGHGGSDPGAVNGSRYEKNDVLKLALSVGRLIQNAGHTVHYTRTNDISLSLSARSYMENIGNYDYFISWHRDSFNATSTGVTCYTYLGYSGKKDGQLARELVNAISGDIFYNRGVKEADFHVLRETKCPAVLVECSFISNPNDNNTFDANFNKLVNNAAQAICRVAGGVISAPPVNPPSPTVSSVKYRVKVGDKQIDAFASLDNAKKCADSNGGIVYDMAGNKIYPYNTNSTDEKYRYGETGIFYPNTTIYFRNAPDTVNSPVIDTYTAGESVKYDTVVIGERYNWISWESASTKERRYMPIRDKKSNEGMWGYVI